MLAITEFDTDLDRAEYAELTLFCYHHFILLMDVDELKAKMSPIYTLTPGKVQIQPIVEDNRFGKIPRGARREDNRYTIYRRNHIADDLWARMTYQQCEAWAQKQRDETGKGVVW